MKVDRNIKQNEHAVSAVIGVTLMVAVTIAMGAVAYAYFTGMIGGNQKVATPAIAFTKSDSEHTITVSTADIGVNWEDVNITFTNGISADFLEKTGPLSAGNTINLDTDQSLTGEVTVAFRHVPSNSQLGTYIFQNVS
ncbi:MAG: type IV pilin [Euryarchaeota archaeon]|nr:type IV pilin [Euryarchaeota archaeon]